MEGQEDDGMLRTWGGKVGTEGPHVLRGHPGAGGEGDPVTSPSPVYKVKLVATENTPSHDNYIMTILSVIKAGTSTPGVGDKGTPRAMGGDSRVGRWH